MRIPQTGETREQFIQRMLNSADVVAEYGDEGMRGAYAAGLWDHRERVKNAGPGNWPKLYRANHLEPGLVHYEADPANGRPKPLTLLLPKSAIDRMRPSFAGKPVVNERHRDMTDNAFQQGDADGIVVGGHWDGSSGQDMVDHFVWSEGAKKNIQNGYGPSCGYDITEWDSTPGSHHNMKYDGVILNGVYNHLAVVKNPRYEQARISLLNAKDSSGGKTMKLMKVLFKKLGLENSAEVEPGKAFALHNGVKLSAEKLLADFKEDQKRQALTNAAADLSPEDTITDPEDGKTYKVADLIAVQARLGNAAVQNCAAPCGKHESQADHEKAVKALNEKGKKEREEEERLDNERKEREKGNLAALNKAAEERSGAGVEVGSFGIAAGLQRGQDLFGAPRPAVKQ